jgi:hypothetical protein
MLFRAITLKNPWCSGVCSEWDVKARCMNITLYICWIFNVLAVNLYLTYCSEDSLVWRIWQSVFSFKTRTHASSQRTHAHMFCVCIIRSSVFEKGRKREEDVCSMHCFGNSSVLEEIQICSLNKCRKYISTQKCKNRNTSLCHAWNIK